MSEKDLNEIGERISRDLKEALDSMDFSKLNETVTETVNVALKEAKESTRKAAEEAKENDKKGSRRSQGEYTKHSLQTGSSTYE